MIKRCFLCGHKMDEKTGLCTNKNCIRSQEVMTAEEKERKAKVKAE